MESNKKKIMCSSQNHQGKGSKYLCFYEECYPSEELKELNASSGWFHRFKHWHSFHNLKLSGEGGSTDEVAASKFSEEFKGIVEERGYSLKQVFNFDETCPVGVLEKNAKLNLHIERSQYSQIESCQGSNYCLVGWKCKW
jgi:hypothetical protein